MLHAIFFSSDKRLQEIFFRNQPLPPPAPPPPSTVQWSAPNVIWRILYNGFYPKRLPCSPVEHDRQQHLEVQLQNLVTSSGHYHGLSDTLHRDFSVFSR